MSESDIDIAIPIGTKVTYHAYNGAPGERGIIKAPAHYMAYIFVVFHCNEDWENYTDYTGQSTPSKKLTIGWENDEVVPRKLQEFDETGESFGI